MPMISQDKNTFPLVPWNQRNFAPEEREDPHWLKTIESAMRLENEVFSLLGREWGSPGFGAMPSQDFDPFDHVEGYEGYSHRFMNANSQAEVDAIKRQIDREDEDRRVLSESGALGTASALAAGILSPINLIPTGWAFRSYRLGGSILKTAATTGALGLASSALTEGVLQSTQVTRTTEESIQAIAAGTFLSGVMGGAFGAFAKNAHMKKLGQLEELKTRIEKELTVPPSMYGIRTEMKSAKASAEAFQNLFAGEDLLKESLQELDRVHADLRAATGKQDIVEAQRTLGQSIVKLEERAAKVQRAIESAPAHQLEPLSLELDLISRDLSTKRGLLHETLSWRKFSDEVAESIRPARRSDLDPAGMRGEALGAARQVPDDAPFKLTRAEFRKKMDRPALVKGLTEVLESKGLRQQAGEGNHDYYRRIIRHYTRKWGLPDIPVEFKKNLKGALGQTFIRGKDGKIEVGKLVIDADADIVTLRHELEHVRDAIKDNYVPKMTAHGGKDDTLLLTKKSGIAAESLGDTHHKFYEDFNPDYVHRQLVKRALLDGHTVPSHVLTDYPDLIGIKPPETALMETARVVGEDPLAPGYLEFPDGVSGSEIASQLKDTFGIAEKLRFNSPLLSALTSESPVTRIVTLNLAESPYKLKGNAQGLVSPIPVENVVRRDMHRVLNTLGQVDELYEAYRKRLAKQPGSRLSHREFGEQVSFALRRGDVSEIPEVKRAAQHVRETFEYFKEKAIRLGMLPEDIDVATAVSYHHRIYNVKKIKAQRPQFVQVVTDWLVEKEIAKLEAGEIEAPRTPDELRRVAQQLTDRITGLPVGRLPYDVTIPDELAPPRAGEKAAPLKKRVFDIEDARIEPWLENDLEYTLKTYGRSMSSDLALREKFGDVEMSQPLEDIRTWWEERLSNPELSEKERLKLTKERDRDLRNVDAMRQRIRGTYALPEDPENFFVRAGKVIRDFQFARVMGSILLGAVPDVGRHIMVNGMSRFMGKGLLPLLRDIKTAGLARKEMEKLNAVVNMAMDTRAMEMSDLMDNYGRGTLIERLSAEGTRLTSNLTGINWWNGTHKFIAAVLTGDTIIETGELLRTTGKAPAKDIERLAAGGISPEMAVRIAEQFAQHGETVNGIRLPKTGNWTDPDAIEHLSAAITRETTITIVEPGQDKPLFLSTPMGKLLGQFKSFFFASTERVLLTGLQDRDLAALSGALTMVGLGSLVYLLGAEIKGQRVSHDPKDILLEGIDRSGITGWFFDANNILEKATRGRLGISGLLGKEPMSRYVSRNLADSFLGPFAGTLQSVGQVTGAAAARDWTEQDTSAARRLIPYQNLLYMRWLFDAGEDRFNTMFGVGE